MNLRIPASLRSLLAGAALCSLVIQTRAGLPDVSLYVVAKGQQFVQTNAGAAVLRTDELPYQFSTFVEPSDLGNVNSVTLQRVPGGSILTLSNAPGENQFRIEEQRFASPAALDAAFPNGDYQFTIITLHQGTQTPTLTLGPGDYPSTPQIANWAALQEANADGSITVTWDVFAGGTADDFVQFSIDGQLGDSIFSTGPPGAPDALNGTNTSITVPAKTLLPDKTYSAHLLFSHGSFNTNAYPGVLGLAAFFKQTGFELVTVSPPPPQGRFAFTSAAYSVGEGGGHVTVAVQRIGGTMDPVSVVLSTIPGTATAGADYQGISTPLSWPDGDDGTKNVNISITDDSALEVTEAFIVTLSQPTGGAELGTPSEAIVTIFDNENAAAGVFRFATTAVAVNENAGSALLTVSRAGGASGQVSVHYSLGGISAVAGEDFDATGGELVFSDGVSSRTISVPIVNDTLDETDETFYVRLLDPTGGASIGTDDEAIVTIRDNENATAGVFRFTTTAVAVNENAGRALLTVSRTGSTSGQVSVRYSLGGISAVAGEDFDATGGTLVFSNGVSIRMISVPILNDTLDETDETFYVRLSDPTGGASIGTNDEAIVTIKDDDTGGLFGFSATLYSVSETGGVANVIVRRSGGVASQATVDLFTLDETATATNDYCGTNVTLVFGANVLAITNSIVIKDDNIPDGDETFRVRLANPTGGARLSSATNSVVRILENEVTLQFSRVAYSNKESAAVAIVMIERSGPVNVPASVEFCTGDETAEAGRDYVATNLVVQFPAGTKRKPVGVRLIKDQIVEGTETLRLSLKNPGPNTLIGPRDAATLSILDDDFGGQIQFAVSNLVVRESAAAASVVLTRSMGKASNVTVRLRTMDLSATDPADYIGTNVVLEWRGNETRKIVPLPIIHDALVEGPEQFKVILSEPTGGATLTNRTNLTVNLVDDDLGGTIGFARAKIVVNENATSAVVIVTRSGGAASNVTVRLSTADGTASAAQPDYAAVNQVLTFGPGEMIKTNLIPINNDALPEGNPPETVLLSLREYTGGAKPGLSNAVIWIVDDESSVSFTTNMVMGTEGTTVTLTVARAGALNTTVSVNFVTVSGTATEGSDYLGTNGTLTFGPNQSRKTFAVKLNSDVLVEANESFTLILANPQGGLQLGAQTNVVVTVKDAPNQTRGLSPGTP
jgi:hypothetical protein